jgi:hypothetical protein
MADSRPHFVSACLHHLQYALDNTGLGIMRPAASVNHFRPSDLIVGCITIRLEKTFELSQKLFRPIPSSAQTEVEHNRSFRSSAYRCSQTLPLTAEPQLVSVGSVLVPAVLRSSIQLKHRPNLPNRCVAQTLTLNLYLLCRP